MKVKELLILLEEKSLEVNAVIVRDFGSSHYIFFESVENIALEVKILGERLLLAIVRVSPSKHAYNALLWPRDGENSNRIYFSSGKYHSVANINYSKFFDSELSEVTHYIQKMLHLN